ILDANTVKRSLTLASGGIAKPTRVSGINEGENTVSGMLGMVKVVDAKGMGIDYEVYEKGGMTADVGKDGEAPASGEPVFEIAELKPVLINTLAYVSKHIEKLSPLEYRARVVESALNALRTKVGKLIAVGNPNAAKAEICGIIHAGAIDGAKDLEISGIDETTLRKIALNYGGDENLDGDCVLVLNKKDLIAFGDVRGTNEKKAVYEIVYDSGSVTTGTIKDGGLAVRFCINSALKSTSDATAGEYSMLYGKGPSYKLDLFGDYTVEVSRDEKFSLGLLSVLGEVMVGGNVIKYNGWMRCKKKATS
ncbi:MAG: phage major capsid protein, partial [Eubacteriales bacterium]